MAKKFNIHGYYCTSNYGGYVIEISDFGWTARVAMDHGDGVHHIGHWQTIKVSARGRSFVNYRGRRLYLDDFMRM